MVPSVLAQFVVMPATTSSPIHAKVSEIGLLEFGHVKIEEYDIDEPPILDSDVRIELLINVVVDLVEYRLHPQHATHEVEQVRKQEVRRILFLCQNI